MFTTAENLTSYQSDNELPFPVLTDPGRVSYRRFGLDRGSVARIWGLRAGRRYLDILRASGRSGLARLTRPTEDPLQLGGDFVIGPDGTLRYGFWGAGPDDRPPVDDLIRAAQGDDSGHL